MGAKLFAHQPDHEWGDSPQYSFEESMVAKCITNLINDTTRQFSILLYLQRQMNFPQERIQNEY